ncbi:hypothetical protein E9993_13655 [Labilibacter sediminis]|nr:hypothetical protein E9993_13655 [Labilibacter sediminis]
MTESGELKVDENAGLRPAGIVPVIAKLTADCSFCGICARSCPTGTIDHHNSKKADKKTCISSARCIEMYPYDARKFKGLMYHITRLRLVEKHQSCKENEVYFPL